MQPLLFELLIRDHERIRAMYAELKAETNQAHPHEEKCLELFRTFKALTVAHAKAEEYVLYALVEEQPDLAPGLQHYAFEGYEEHDLIDFLMKEMGQAEEITPQWRAQLTVLTEMLDHHLSDEEKDFFPRIRVLLSREQSQDLGVQYSKEREEIFAKKSGSRSTTMTTPTAPH